MSAAGSSATASKARRFAIAFVAAAIVMMALDAVWLSTMAARLYRPALGPIMRPDFDALAAAAFYAIYISGVVVFAVQPSPSARGTLARGALFGFVCYATYDLTNQATVAGWPWRVTFIDLAWGTFLTATSAWASHRALRFARR